LFQSLVDAQVTRRGRQVKRHTANDYLFYWLLNIKCNFFTFWI
jgi:hypothetical protein